MADAYFVRFRRWVQQCKCFNVASCMAVIALRARTRPKASAPCTPTGFVKTAAASAANKTVVTLAGSRADFIMSILGCKTAMIDFCTRCDRKAPWEKIPVCGRSAPWDCLASHYCSLLLPHFYAIRAAQNLLAACSLASPRIFARPHSAILAFHIAALRDAIASERPSMLHAREC